MCWRSPGPLASMAKVKHFHFGKKGRTNELNGWKLATGQAALFIATSIGPHPSKCSTGLQGLFFF